jgi:DNA-binding transcriptional LysR family regulator
MNLDINLHFLKTFYYVAKYGGIRMAARMRPQKIEPSSISRQIRLLEQEIGVPLFQRRPQPFEVTPEGAKLFAFSKPIFEGLPILIEELRRSPKDLLRLGAAPVVLRDYMPALVESLEKRFPDLSIEYHEGLQWQIEEWFKQGQLDFAVTMIEGAVPESCLSELLLRLPMVLLVQDQSPLRSAADIWRQRPIKHRLICPKMNDAITRCFRDGLLKRNIEWVSRREAGSIEMAESHVRRGLGITVSLAIPGRDFGPGLRALPLPDFPLVRIGMIWRPSPNAATRAMMQLVREQARKMTQAGRKQNR